VRDRSALRDRVHGPKEWDTFKPGEEAKRIVPNTQIASDNPNLKGPHARSGARRRQRSNTTTPCRAARVSGLDGAWAREVFRVLKPGAYIVVCCAPRSYHRMACGLEDAGFVIRDKFSWLFGSGFPKNYNLGDGKGTALKPAHEPIALAWKPFKGRSKPAMRARDGGAEHRRVPPRCGIKDTAGTSRRKAPVCGQRRNGPRCNQARVGGSDLGRWPANVLLDEDAAPRWTRDRRVVSGGTGSSERRQVSQRVWRVQGR
jgi:hypothetical protein